MRPLTGATHQAGNGVVPTLAVLVVTVCSLTGSLTGSVMGGLQKKRPAFSPAGISMRAERERERDGREGGRGGEGGERERREREREKRERERERESRRSTLNPHPEEGRVFAARLE